MIDTGFSVPGATTSRLAALYAMAPGLPEKFRYDALGEPYKQAPQWLLRRRRAGVDQPRLHAVLPDAARRRRARRRAAALAAHGPLHEPQPPARRRGPRKRSAGRCSSETRYDGVGFGLGLAVTDDPVAAKVLSGTGESYWGGMASTAFWVDPAEELAVVFMTQLLPSSTYPHPPASSRQLVYQSLVD